MGWQPGQDGGTGASPDGDPGMPGGTPMRDPRLAAFAPDGGRGAPVPSGRLALLADELSGAERRCRGATGGELMGLLRAWAAIESWAAGAKLGVIAELIRHDDAPRNGGYHGDLPDEWSPSLRHELAAALACSAQSAETTAWLAWEQRARLPGIGARLDDGTLTAAKARAVAETFRFLMDADAAKAEALIADQLAGKTYPQVLRLAEQAALTVDPGLAERRREHAQRKDARVSFFREDAGTAALSGRDLPPDEALAAMASVNARAEEYQQSDAFGDTPMDVLRAYAYLDLLNAVPAEARIACAEAQDEAAEAAEALAWAQARAAARTAAEAKAANGTEAETGAESGTESEARTETGNGAASRTETGTGTGTGAEAEAWGGVGTPPAPDAGGYARGNPAPDEPGARRPSVVPPDLPDPCESGSGTQAGPCGRPCAERDGDCIPDDGRRGPADPFGPGADTDDHNDDSRDHQGSRHDDDDGSGHGDDDDDDEPGGGGDDGGGPGSGGPGPGGPTPGPGAPPAGQAPQRRPADLIVPLATLLGLAERPGEIQGFGLLDPALARDLAAVAAASPRTEVCVTVTSPEGYAIGHGCARPDRVRRGAREPGPGTALAGLPARLNLTIPATALPGLASHAGLASQAGPWAFTPRGSPGPPGSPDPPDGYGTWALTLPGGRRFTVHLEPVPVFECDHRYESHGYQPSDKLRHLVQIRDGTCTFPPCSRHARESDFEHAVPYDKGGRTCACNAGARSRQCHRIKQSKGWNVTQPRPGWHQWETLSGHVYVQEPKRYPA